jgi:hypothetical protein
MIDPSPWFWVGDDASNLAEPSLRSALSYFLSKTPVRTDIATGIDDAL